MNDHLQLPLRRSTSESSFLSLKFPLKTSKPLDHSIFVANLDYHLTNQQLASDLYCLFSKYAPISPITVSRDKLGRPFAFITFKSMETINQILKMELYLHSRLLRIERSKSNSTIEIHNINEFGYSSLEEIEQVLLNFGTIQRLYLIGYKLYCTFTSRQAASNALVFLREIGLTAQYKRQSSTIRVVNLPKNEKISQHDLENLFSGFGNIKNIQFYPGINDVSFVLITFQNSLEAKQSLCMDGFEYKSTHIHVELIDSKTRDELSKANTSHVMNLSQTREE